MSTAMLGLLLPAAARAASEDPWEPANRTFYMVHRFLDDTVFAKAAPIFKYIPSPIRAAIRNIIANLTEPGVAANDLLQGHPDVSARTVGRFAANTTVGLGGMIDVAARLGLPHHDNGFADTFGRWGVYPGPYLFIPLMGPTTVRDGLGSIADTLTDPFTWSRFYHRWTIIDVRAVWSGLDQRTEADSQIRAIYNMSTDSYATLRSLYLQNREAVIATPPGASPATPTLPALPDFGDPGAAPPPADGPQGAAPPATAPADGGAAPSSSPAPPPETAPDAKPVSLGPVSPDSDVLATNRDARQPPPTVLAMATAANL